MEKKNCFMLISKPNEKKFSLSAREEKAFPTRDFTSFCTKFSLLQFSSHSVTAQERSHCVALDFLSDIDYKKHLWMWGKVYLLLSNSYRTVRKFLGVLMLKIKQTWWSFISHRRCLVWIHDFTPLLHLFQVKNIIIRTLPKKGAEFFSFPFLEWGGCCLRIFSLFCLMKNLLIFLSTNFRLYLLNNGISILYLECTKKITPYLSAECENIWSANETQIRKKKIHDF